MPSPKVTMRGIVHEISGIEYTGANNDYPRQRVTLYCPVKRDQLTGKPNGRDEFFMLDILGKNVDGLNIHDGYLDKVVEVEVRFNGTCYKKKDGSGRGYAINCNLVNMTIIADAIQECTQAAVDLQMGY